MKRTVLFIILLSFFAMEASSQKFNDLINLKCYSEENKQVSRATANDRRIVFIGNSITEGWARMRPQFFTDNNFIGRGIGGQTSPQLLSRFRSDVVELNPYAVIINVGTNDIAENTGTYDQNFTLGNIKSMAEIAKANNIQVILSSVLPAAKFGWIPTITDSVEKIEALNREIKKYAATNNFIYIDYHTQLKDDEGGLKSHFGDDGVHPNSECYELMESIVLKTIGIALK